MCRRSSAVEQGFCKAKVGGSNPFAGSIIKPIIIKIAGSSNGRTAAFGAAYVGSTPTPAASEKKSRLPRFARQKLLNNLNLTIDTLTIEKLI